MKTHHTLSRAGNAPNFASIRSGQLNTYDRAFEKFFNAIRRKSAKRTSAEEDSKLHDLVHATVKPAVKVSVGGGK